MRNVRWDSHLPSLTRCLVATSGAVLEFGRGESSTPFLGMYCAAAGRRLVSVDDQPEWAKIFPQYPGELVNYDTFSIEGPWDVVLIDQHPGSRRAADCARLRNKTKLLVVHDVDEAEIWDPFQPMFVAGFWPFVKVDMATAVLCRDEQLWRRLWAP